MSETSALRCLPDVERFVLCSIPTACVFVIGIVGWVLLLAISPVHATANHLHIRYFGCICIVVRDARHNESERGLIFL